MVNQLNKARAEILTYRTNQDGDYYWYNELDMLNYELNELERKENLNKIVKSITDKF